jgi:hypothetical protein
MRRQLRWYGASPLHLLAMLACFGLAGYAAARLIPSAPLGVAVWFLGAVIGHDLVLMPLYSLADRSAIMAIRHREPQLPAGPWINYLRVPAALSGLLLLVWFPLILRLPSPYHASTTLSADPYVWHWLGVTGALFLLSAVALAFRLRRSSRSVPTSKGPGAAADATDPDHKGGPEAPNDESGPETGNRRRRREVRMLTNPRQRRPLTVMRSANPRPHPSRPPPKPRTRPAPASSSTPARRTACDRRWTPSEQSPTRVDNEHHVEDGFWPPECQPVLSIAEAHQGQVSVVNTQKCCRFEVRLPVLAG